MAYPKEMCLHLLNNTDLIESQSLTEYVEVEVFKAINLVVARKLGDRTPWKKRLGLVTGDEDDNEETTFARLAWPTKVGGEELAYFHLWENDSDINEYWLSHALGLHMGRLCFEFRMKPKPGGPTPYRIKKAIEEFYAANQVLKDEGFIHHKRGGIYLPFKLDVNLVIKEFPDLKTAIAPVNEALDKVLGKMELFDKLVREVYPIEKA